MRFVSFGVIFFLFFFVYLLLRRASLHQPDLCVKHSFLWSDRSVFCHSDLSLSLSLSDQKLKEMRILSLQKQLEYNKGLFMYRLLSNEAPEYISNLYTHTPSRYSNSRTYHLSLPRPRIDIFSSSPLLKSPLTHRRPMLHLNLKRLTESGKKHQRLDHNTLLTATPRAILPNPATGETNITIVVTKTNASLSLQSQHCSTLGTRFWMVCTQKRWVALNETTHR